MAELKPDRLIERMSQLGQAVESLMLSRNSV
jgi:hypothetical protein